MGGGSWGWEILAALVAIAPLHAGGACNTDQVSGPCALNMVDRIFSPSFNTTWDSLPDISTGELLRYPAYTSRFSTNCPIQGSTDPKRYCPPPGLGKAHGCKNYASGYALINLGTAGVIANGNSVRINGYYTIAEISCHFRTNGTQKREFTCSGGCNNLIRSLDDICAGAFAIEIEGGGSCGDVALNSKLFVIPATMSPMSFAPTTTTAIPTSRSPKTLSPATGNPVTVSPISLAPTTAIPTSRSPKTLSPATGNPVTVSPISLAPTTAIPTSRSPKTLSPATRNPVTVSPISLAPTPTNFISGSPITLSPVTVQPSSSPATGNPITMGPVSVAPTTAIPTSKNPKTLSPATVQPSANPFWSAAPTAAPVAISSTGDVPLAISIVSPSGCVSDKVDLKTHLRLKVVADWKLAVGSDPARPSSSKIGGSFVWSCVSGNLDVGSSSGVQILPTGPESSVLVIAPHTLSVGTRYVFVATATSSFTSQTGRAELQLITNVPPSSGWCSCYPAQGIALKTTFRLSCSGWSDTDLPLKYQFQLRLKSRLPSSSPLSSGLGVSTAKNTSLVDLSPRQLSSFHNTTLSGGAFHPQTGEPQPERIGIQAKVFDSFGATSIAHFYADISQPTQFEAQAAESSLRALLGQNDTQRFVAEFAGVLSYVHASAESKARTNLSESRQLRKNLLKLLVAKENLEGGNGTERAMKTETASILLESTTDFSDKAEVDVEASELAAGLLLNLTRSGIEESGRTGEESVSLATSMTLTMSNILSASSGNASSTNGSQEETNRRPASLIKALDGALSNLQYLLLSSSMPGETPVTVSSSSRPERAQLDFATRLVDPNATTAIIERTLEISGRNLSFSCPSVLPDTARMVTGNLQISMVFIGGDTLYPPPESSSSSPSPVGGGSRRQSEDLVRIELSDPASRQMLQVSNAPEPFIFTVPRPAVQAVESAASNEPPLTIKDACVYWDVTGEHWSRTGVTTTTSSSSSSSDSAGLLQCKSYHLTSFSSREESQVSLEVNQVDEESAHDTRSFDPTKNRMMALIIGVLTVALCTYPFVRCFDLREVSEEKIEPNEKDFWRRWNRFHKLHKEGARSVTNWCWAMGWSIRRNHPWVAVFLRHPGDYLNSQKRLLILVTIITNSATVCCLLIGTTQNVPVLSGESAAALLACLMAFPVPFMLARVFSRSVPDDYRIPFESMGMFPLLALLLALVGDVEFEVGGGGEGGGEGSGDGAETNNNQDDIGDDDDNENDDAEASRQTIFVGGGVAAGGAVGGWVSERGGGGRKAGKMEWDEKEDGEMEQKKKKHRKLVRRMSTDLHMAPKRKLQTGFYQGDDKPSVSARQSTVAFEFWAARSYDVWLLSDVFGIAVCTTLILGCSFLIAALSWRFGGSGVKIVTATTLALGESVFLRVGVIAVLEAVMLAPLYCYLCSGKRDEVRSHQASSKRRTLTLSCDVPTCVVDEKGRVERVHDAAAQSGIGVGWRLLSVNSQEVTNNTELRKALKIAHAVDDTMELVFEMDSSESELEALHHHRSEEMDSSSTSKALIPLSQKNTSCNTHRRIVLPEPLAHRRIVLPGSLESSDSKRLNEPAERSPVPQLSISSLA